MPNQLSRQQVVTIASLPHSAAYCHKCTGFLRWERLEGPRLNESEYFYHHPTGSALKKSAQQSCPLCQLLYHQIHKCRHPEHETEPPDRQIRLSIRYPSIDSGTHRLHISVEPADIKSAGLHDLSEVHPDIVCRSIIMGENVSRETVVSVAHAMATAMRTAYERLGQIRYFVIENEPTGVLAYFRVDQQISEDEFFARTLPFWNAELDLRLVEREIDAIMSMNLASEDNGTDSSSVLRSLQFWLWVCRSMHPYCTTARNEKHTDPLLPKRILDLGQREGSSSAGATSPPVLVCPPPGTTGRYATLSHRWGERPLIRTLSGNIYRWQKEVPWEELPGTFKDAIDITKKLGLRYLWIDSLCIVQDSPEDWREQSACMGNIYRKAEICIAASGAKDCNDGMYHRREPLSSPRPVRLWDKPLPGLCMQAAGANAPVYGFPTTLDADPDILRGRGWVLQEELLSPRRVMFGRHLVSWECLTMEVNTHQPLLLEGTPDTFEYEGEFNWHQFFYAGISGLLGNLSDIENMNTAKFYKSWLFMVHEYCSRQLTKMSDRLAALAGIAVEFQNVTQDQYLCGMWKRYLWRQLLWSVAARGSPSFNRSGETDLPESRLVDGFSAPSWSWAGIEGPIRLFYARPLEDMDSHDVLVEVIDAECTPGSPADVSSSYTGRLMLRGSVTGAVVKLFAPSLDLLAIKKQFPGVPEVPFTAPTKMLSTLEGVVRRGEEFGVAQVAHAEKSCNEGSSDALVGTTFGAPHPYHTTVHNRIAKAVLSKDLSSLPSWNEYRAWLNDQSYNPAREANEAARVQQTGTVDEMRLDQYQTFGKAYLGHPIFDPQSGNQVGYWAPDLPGSTAEREITCLAISKYRSFVQCLGLESVGKSKGRYKRIGLAYWHVAAWNHTSKTDNTVVEIF